jgi:hypothetical protein
VDLACDALLAAYPGRFTAASATAWVRERRARLTERAGPRTDHGLAVSSGCAASGAHSHVQVVAAEAAHALRRLDAGLGPVCDRCASVLAYERLDGAPAAVRCTRCTAPSTADTRWCR